MKRPDYWFVFRNATVMQAQDENDVNRNKKYVPQLLNGQPVVPETWDDEQRKKWLAGFQEAFARNGHEYHVFTGFSDPDAQPPLQPVTPPKPDAITARGEPVVSAPSLKVATASETPQKKEDPIKEDERSKKDGEREHTPPTTAGNIPRAASGTNADTV